MTLTTRGYDQAYVNNETFLPPPKTQKELINRAMEVQNLKKQANDLMASSKMHGQKAQEALARAHEDDKKLKSYEQIIKNSKNNIENSKNSIQNSKNNIEKLKHNIENSENSMQSLEKDIKGAEEKRAKAAAAKAKLEEIQRQRREKTGI